MATLLNGNPLPAIIYGTASRDKARAADVFSALTSGYRAIDTASSKRFHQESEDGESLAKYLAENDVSVSREGIFIQSKYGPPPEQDEPWPYDIGDDNKIRVFKSVLRSATDLGVDVLDVYFLHTPLNSEKANSQAWGALEQIVDRGGIRYLGIANVRLSRLQQVFDQARIKPKFVQNWFRETNGYDREVMKFCQEKGIVYQIFGLFDEANAPLLEYDPVRRLAASRSISKHQALLQMVYAAATQMSLQLCILDGTRDLEHMKQNLSAVNNQERIDEADVTDFLGRIAWQ